MYQGNLFELEELEEIFGRRLYELRALSVRQPFANRFLSGEKDRERRFQPTSFRGEFLIYASKKIAKFSGDLGPLDLMPRGVIVGWATLTDCVKEDDKEYAWIVENVKSLDFPVKPRRRPKQCWFRPFADER